MKQTILALGASCALGAVVGGWAYWYVMARAMEKTESVRGIYERLLAAVADQFRTSAVAIAYSAGLLEELRGDESKIRSAIQRLVVSTEDLTRMADELMEMSEDQGDPGGAVSLLVAPCDVGAEIHRVVAKDNAPWSEHIVRAHAPEGLETATDVRKVRRVLEALLSNAAEYSARGSLIVVRVHASGSELVFSIDDEGPGIEPFEQERVFETLYRGDISRLARPGLGLGLPLANRMVSDLGGRLWVESHPVRGSTFSFTIPIGGPPKFRRMTRAAGQLRAISG